MFQIHWLGQWYVIKTFDKMDECDVDEILEMLGEDGNSFELDRLQ